MLEVKNKQNVSFITVNNNLGLEITLCTLGASIYDLKVKDKNDCLESIVVTPKDYNEFYTTGAHYGKTVGRFAGRIENGNLSIDGVDYKLLTNDGNGNSLHGGKYGLAFENFKYDIFEDYCSYRISFKYLELENDLPGDVAYKISYVISKEKNEFKIVFEALPNKTTLINLTNHTYFNLSGNLKNTILDQKLKLNCDRYTNLNDNLITKSIDNVNEVMDFRTNHAIGNFINDPSILNHKTNGYDHCFLKKELEDLQIAVLIDEKSNRRMEVYTDYPCIVIYTDNYPSEGPLLQKEAPHLKHDGICFECQYVPNGINMEGVEKGLVKANKTSKHFIKYLFN